MLALPGHTSEQRTGNKPKKHHLTGKAPYKFESTPLQQRVCEPSAASMASCSTRWCTAPISRNSMAMCSDGGGLQLKRVLPLQRHHPHPEHHLVADVDVVFTHEGQLAVVADTKHRQAGGY